jgi:sigma-54 specific flagellar transcriptional regulator A
VRELANLIERLAIMYPRAVVDVEDLPEKFRRYSASETMTAALPADEDLEPLAERAILGNVLFNQSPQLPEHGLDLKEYLSDLESSLIQQALAECNGVVAHAAKRLKMQRTTLVEKLRKYDLSR